MLRDWSDLPDNMRTDAVRPYYESLKKKKVSLFFKRLFDILASGTGLIILSPFFLIISILITLDSKGGVFFRQERVTQYGRIFRIHKFRTMVADAESRGAKLTVKNDMRITKIGAKLRDVRLDEIPQLIDILCGDMTLVGTRPEVIKYVKQYTPEMMATLLLPAGITNEACIKYKDEGLMLENAEDVDKVYITEVLPGKMKYNLDEIMNYSFLNDIMLLFRTAFAVLK